MIARDPDFLHEPDLYLSIHVISRSRETADLHSLRVWARWIFGSIGSLVKRPESRPRIHTFMSIDEECEIDSSRIGAEGVKMASQAVNTLKSERRKLLFESKREREFYRCAYEAVATGAWGS